MTESDNPRVEELKEEILRKADSRKCDSEKAELLARKHYHYSQRCKESELWKPALEDTLKEISTVCQESDISNLASYDGIKPAQVAELSQL